MFLKFIISKEITGVLNVGSGRGQSLKSIINLIGNKLEVGTNINSDV